MESDPREIKKVLSEIRKRGPIQTENIGARLDKDSKERLESICRKEKVTVSALIYKLVKDFLATYNKAS